MYHSFYDLCAFGGQDTLLKHAIQLGKTQCGPLWLTILSNKIYTCDSTENNELLLHRKDYQKSSRRVISEIF